MPCMKKQRGISVLMRFWQSRTAAQPETRVSANASGTEAVCGNKIACSAHRRGLGRVTAPSSSPELNHHFSMKGMEGKGHLNV